MKEKHVAYQNSLLYVSYFSGPLQQNRKVKVSVRLELGTVLSQNSVTGPTLSSLCSHTWGHLGGSASGDEWAGPVFLCRFELSPPYTYFCWGQDRGKISPPWQGRGTEGWCHCACIIHFHAPASFLFGRKNVLWGNLKLRSSKKLYSSYGKERREGGTITLITYSAKSFEWK